MVLCGSCHIFLFFFALYFFSKVKIIFDCTILLFPTVSYQSTGIVVFCLLLILYVLPPPLPPMVYFGILIHVFLWKGKPTK